MPAIRRWAALLTLSLIFAMPARAGLGDSLDKLGQNLGGALGQFGQNLGGSLGQFGQNLGGSLGQISGVLDGSLTQSLGALGYSLTRLGQQYLMPTEGTIAVTDSVEHRGVSRPLIIIEPQNVSPEKAPLIVLLHFSNGNAETMANLTRAGRLAAEYGAWIVLPEGTARRWDDDPSSSPSSGDVDFLVKVIAHMSSAYPVDPQRVYMAGMSNGGFMTERFICEQSELIAAAAIDAATLRNTQSAACAPKRAVPVVYFAGTDDPVVNYDAPLGMLSAEANFARWSGIHGCNPASRQDSSLPPEVDDGTSIELSENWDCSSGGAVRLFTIVGGGHAWPGGEPVAPQPWLGTTTQNLDATEAMWDFMSLFTL
ncbi:MAG: hypothetical protein JWQ90_1851 [Hydrocarboniphaga sp.]|uniref:alpha/beta hydrolase family esterase n=1 Tax=Hydrocarboniphaga sp. TaxID=2033016 RepID=UPI00262559AD|nr:PHB depolymerase family esterase [Hydrocarboniphaga sp.]MDB5969401.1 hypothetical protein [Hydrocarboniphaga sp.]